VRGFWDFVWRLVTHQPTHLLALDRELKRMFAETPLSVDLGLADIPVKQIVGSVDRYQDFTQDFLPRLSDEHSRERWRTIYTLTVTGAALPPIKVYKIGSNYFVEDGHHRTSVASYLGWEVIHAHITELLPPTSPTSAIKRKWPLFSGSCI
jgi:hypothetical protein